MIVLPYGLDLSRGNEFNAWDDWYSSIQIDGDISDIEAEIEAALPLSQGRLIEARANQDYYERRNEGYLEKREAESEVDFRERPKRTLSLTRRVVDVLCSHTYTPGPSRRLPDAAGDAWLQAVYKQAEINTLLLTADRLAHATDCAAIQIAATGDTLSPVRLHVWGAEELEVWTSPADPTAPWAVCTLAIVGNRRRYQLWTATEYRTYYTKPWQSGDTTGGTHPRYEPAESGPNPYGCLPFVFVPLQRPTRQFWCGGLGTAIRRANAEVDRELSDLAQLVQRYTAPFLFLKGVSDKFRLTQRAGGWQHLQPINAMQTNEPAAELIQPQIDVEGVWRDIEQYINHTLQSEGVPLSAWRLDQHDAMSGIAIVAEQIPLIQRAKQRQIELAPVEVSLAETVLLASAHYYRRSDLLKAALTVAETYEVLWPEPVIPLPTPERDQADQWELSEGLTSRTQVLMRRRGLTRAQAREQLDQILADLTHERTLIDALTPPPSPGPGQAGAGPAPPI